MLTLSSRVTKNKDIPYRIIEREAVLVDVASGNVIQLSEVAAFIWEQIDGNNTTAGIIDSVSESFEVGKHKAEKDSLEFLNKLLEKGIISLI